MLKATSSVSFQAGNTTLRSHHPAQESIRPSSSSLPVSLVSSLQVACHDQMEPRVPVTLHVQSVQGRQHHCTVRGRIQFRVKIPIPTSVVVYSIPTVGSVFICKSNRKQSICLPLSEIGRKIVAR